MTISEAGAWFVDNILEFAFLLTGSESAPGVETRIKYAPTDFDH